MKINELKLISSKFRELLVKYKKYTLSELKSLDQGVSKNFNTQSFNTIFKKGFLSTFKGNQEETTKHYSDIAEILIKSGLPKKYITGKKHYEKYNKQLTVNNDIGIYSTIIINSLARRLV
ncbi:MAG: hypothetical protein ACK4IX_07690, partial [Candidatus Sericytochromatia bacterium]